MKTILDHDIDAVLISLHCDQVIVVLYVNGFGRAKIFGFGNEEIKHLGATLVVEDIVVTINFDQVAQCLAL